MNVILLTEDRELDSRLVRQALAGTSIDLHCVNTGEDCLMFLRKQGAYFDAPTPDLVLLDLSLPGMDGREVLLEIKRDKDLKYLPVVIFTGAMEERDLFRQYEAGCSGYIVKPNDYDELTRTLRSIITYWFYVVVLPRKA